jgi:uncharacterized phage protein gp47/JayE
MPVYGVKGRSEILTDIMNSLEKSAGISAVYPGSIARAFADAIGSEMSDLYEAFRFTIQQSELSTASGRNLDLIGDLYGVPRKSVTDFVSQERMSFNVEFFIQNPYSGDIVIPDGTLIFNDVTNFATKQYSFKIIGEVYLPAGSTKAYGKAVPNFDDNTYVAPRGTLTKHNYIAPASVTVFVTNPKEIYSNVTGESDENYRRRIIASIKTRANGTLESVRFAALSVKGVRDVRIREASYGLGSCDVIVVPEVASQVKELPNIILSSILKVKPAGIRFNIRIAEQVPINISAIITLGRGVTQAVANSVSRQAQLFVRRYLNSLTIGSVVSLSEIQRQIQNSSDLIRSSATITLFNANGKDLPLEDYIVEDIRYFPSAGSVVVSSAIIGTSNY